MNIETSVNNRVGSSEEELNIIVELVWLDLQGTISRDVVCQTVSSLLGKYDQAKVRRFVPLLVQREARDVLAGKSSIGNRSDIQSRF